jgi:hypothetical protein
VLLTTEVNPVPKTNAKPSEFARAALRAHVATELGKSACHRDVLAEVALRLKLAKTSPEQARANAIVIEGARLLVGDAS